MCVCQISAGGVIQEPNLCTEAECDQGGAVSCPKDPNHPLYDTGTCTWNRKGSPFDLLIGLIALPPYAMYRVRRTFERGACSGNAVVHG